MFKYYCKMRTISALSSLSDAILADIGIKRSEIAAHVEGIYK